MRIAVIHEWLSTYAGSERVLEQILAIYPDADLFAVVDFLEGADRDWLGGRPVRTTFIQGLPLARRCFRAYLPLMPMAIEQLNLDGYDLVISSAHAVAKGVLTRSDQLHVSYVHTPMRYAWDMHHEYLGRGSIAGAAKSAAARCLMHYLRLWDQSTARRVDSYVANSRFVARRIRKVYGRKATVVHPPVDVETFAIREEKDDFYLAASRLVPYKRVDLVVEAFNRMPDRKLVVIGEGPEAGRLAKMAGPNVTLLGYQSSDVLCDHMQRAKAYVFAAQEDFGITIVEAQACGTPVVCLGKGGGTESVIEGRTGVFFDDQTPESLIDAIGRFEATAERLEPHFIRRHAERFSPERFRAEFSAVVERAVDESRGVRPSRSGSVRRRRATEVSSKG
jgi:glycosyltransferase involved in cell wall biosynthesis